WGTPRARESGDRRFLDDAKTLVGGLLLVVERQDVRLDRALDALHLAVGGLAQVAVREPLGVVTLRIIGAVVIETPAAFGAEERSVRGHLRAVVNVADFERAHE